jgi:hypothetical protein
MIQIRAPNGKNIQGYFDPYITMINVIMLTNLRIFMILLFMNVEMKVFMEN